jgi:ABC-2 type transport system permease protein
MKPYFSYFKKELLESLQYREAAIAGLTTQFFWGILYAFVYEAFYSHANIDNINFQQLMCYVWLNQAFFSLIAPGVKDNQILEQIRNGTVAHELCRPYDLYWWWYLKHLAKRYAACALRCIPVLIFAFLIPKPYNLTLPVSVEAFLLFIISLFFGTLIITGIGMIIQLITFFTLQDKGISSIISLIQGLLSGFDIPLPLLPVILLTLTKFMPFRLISDLSQRIYSGNINIVYGLQSILLQIVWITILVLIGRLIMKIALKKVVIQGG